MGDNSSSAAAEIASAVAKSDAGQEATPSSLESTPERETEAVQDPALPQKRKGGRKPVRLLCIVSRQLYFCSNVTGNYGRANEVQDLCYL